MCENWGHSTWSVANFLIIFLYPCYHSPMVSLVLYTLLSVLKKHYSIGEKIIDSKPQVRKVNFCVWLCLVLFFFVFRVIPTITLYSHGTWYTVLSDDFPLLEKCLFSNFLDSRDVFFNIISTDIDALKMINLCQLIVIRKIVKLGKFQPCILGIS